MSLMVPLSSNAVRQSEMLQTKYVELFNPLSRKIHIQNLKTELPVFLLRIVERIWFKIIAFLPLKIFLVNLINFTLHDLLMLIEEN